MRCQLSLSLVSLAIAIVGFTGYCFQFSAASDRVLREGELALIWGGECEMCKPDVDYCKSGPAFCYQANPTQCFAAYHTDIIRVRCATQVSPADGNTDCKTGTQTDVCTRGALCMGCPQCTSCSGAIINLVSVSIDCDFLGAPCNNAP